jgi:YHS domain-containing protein
MNQRKFSEVLLAACVLLSACAATPGRIRQTKPVAMLDAPQGLALEGYDVVSYFESSEAHQGSADYVHRYRGADWQFASAAHRALFAANPERFAPQYGNYCAFAVSRGGTAHGDPKLWAIVGDKLYLNNNRFAMDLWDEDRPGNIAAGDQNWPLLPKLPSR